MLAIIENSTLAAAHDLNDRHRRLIAGYLDATIRGDLQRVGACLTDDCIVWLPRSAEKAGLPRPLVGRTAFLDLVRHMLESPAHWRPTSLTPLRFFFAEDAVSVHLRLIGTMPNSTTYDNEYVFLYELRGDRISEIREFTDTAHISDFLAENQRAGGTPP